MIFWYSIFWYVGLNKALVTYTLCLPVITREENVKKQQPLKRLRIAMGEKNLEGLLYHP